MTALPRAGRAVVTGASGFVGAHAGSLLRASGYEVVAVSAAEHDLTKTWPDLGRIDAVLHLAGLAAVGPSFDDPQRYLDVNSSMMTNLGEYLLSRREEMAPRVVVVSSGAVYGPSDSPLTEESPLVVTSPYAVSKVLVETQARYYANRGLDLVIARPFNHIGPGQGPGFIVPDLAAKLQALTPGERLIAGNLDSGRDYTDVRDVVRAYQGLLEAERLDHAEYNIGSGVSRTGWEVLETLSRSLGRDVPTVEMTVQRGVDPDRVTASAARLNREIGWAPKIDFETSIRDYLG